MNPQQQFQPAPNNPVQQGAVYDQYGNPLPIAGYDHLGNPLYAAPSANYPSGPNGVQQQASGQIELQQSHPQGGHQGVHFLPDESPEAQRLHEESRRRYPNLNLSKGEFVIHEVKRTIVGAVKIWSITAVLLVALVAFLFGMLRSGGYESLGVSVDQGSVEAISIFIVFVFSLLVIAGAVIATYVYYSNRFYLTNESVIQDIRITIFSRFSQMVALSNVEDVSFHQDGVLQTMFNYGTVRLSTIGGESTYNFTYADNPKVESDLLGLAVEQYKSGRKVDLSELED